MFLIKDLSAPELANVSRACGLSLICWAPVIHYRLLQSRSESNERCVSMSQARAPAYKGHHMVVHCDTGHCLHWNMSASIIISQCTKTLGRFSLQYFPRSVINVIMLLWTVSHCPRRPGAFDLLTILPSFTPFCSSRMPLVNVPRVRVHSNLQYPPPPPSLSLCAFLRALLANVPAAREHLHLQYPSKNRIILSESKLVNVPKS